MSTLVDSDSRKDLIRVGSFAESSLKNRQIFD